MSVALLSYRINTLSIWVDEEVVLRIARAPSLVDVVEENIRGHRRPPLYQLALHLWMRLAGESDIAGRGFSVLFGLGCVGLIFILGREFSRMHCETDPAQPSDLTLVSLLPAYLLTISPFFILYARIIRYYTFVMFLGLLSSLFYLRLLREYEACGSRKINGEQPAVHRQWLWTVGYLLCSLMLLYADYLAIALLAAQTLWLALKWRHYKPMWPRWLVTQAVLLIAYLPWVPVQFRQATAELLHADLAQSIVGSMLSLGYPIYSFSVGETMFPWELPAIVGVLICAFLVAQGLVLAKRRSSDATRGAFLTRNARIFSLICLGLSLFVTSTVLSFIAPDITFLSSATRIAFAAPFFYLLAAGGLAELPSRLRGLLLIALTLVGAYGLGNYYTGRNFHNPIYTVPLRQVVEDVVLDLQPEDIVISEDDTMFGYYYERRALAAPHFGDPVDRGEWEQAVAHDASRVWLVTLGRDLSRLVHPTGEIIRQLESEDYHLVESRGYVPQDRLYRRLKARILGRPAYEYKVVVRLYQKSG